MLGRSETTFIDHSCCATTHHARSLRTFALCALAIASASVHGTRTSRWQIFFTRCFAQTEARSCATVEVHGDGATSRESD